jgi:hypothetical protein
MNRKVDLGDPLPLPYKRVLDRNVSSSESSTFAPIRPIKLERSPPVHIKLRDKPEIRHDDAKNLTLGSIDSVPDKLYDDTTLVKTSFDTYFSQIETGLRHLATVCGDDVLQNIDNINHELQQIYRITKTHAQIELSNESRNQAIAQLEQQILDKQLQLNELKTKLPPQIDIPQQDIHDPVNDSNIFDEMERLQKLQRRKPHLSLDSKLYFLLGSILVILVSGLLVSDLNYDYCYYFC